MTLGLRVVLILGSVLFVGFVIRKIRASTIEFGDALFWVAFSFYLLLIAMFPSVVDFMCGLIGVQTPVNMVYLSITALLSYKCFSMAIKLSVLSLKLKTLVSVISAQSQSFQKVGSEIESKEEERF